MSWVIKQTGGKFSVHKKGDPSALHTAEDREGAVRFLRSLREKAFSADGATFAEDEPSVVYRVGKVFELGNYPDKQIDLSDPTEFDSRAIAAFEPVEGDIEHRISPFDGRLGRLIDVWRDGTEVFGTVEVPKPLHDLYGDDPLGVSLTFDRETKQIKKFAYTANPRISDAALMSAFSTTEEEEAQFKRKADYKKTMQEAHDATGRYFRRKHGESGETAAAYSIEEDAQFYGVPYESVYAAREIHRLASQNGAYCNCKYVHIEGAGFTADPPATPPADGGKGKKKMTFDEFWAGLKAQFGGSEGEGGGGTEPKPKAEFTDRERKLLMDRAGDKADALVTAKKILPADRDGVAAQFFLALQDDERDPQSVTFGSTKLESRVAALEARFTAAPAVGEGLSAEVVSGSTHGLDPAFTGGGNGGGEGAGGDDNKVLFANNTEFWQERKKKLQAENGRAS